MLNADFAITSETQGHPDRLFGYAFHGADIVVGEEGRRDFEKARGRQLEPGLDGCYTLIRNQGARLDLGTDFGGLGKLFLYRSGSFWAVSNSFYRLVREARAVARPVTLDLAHLSSFFADNTIGGQLLSLHTSIREIELVPNHRFIRIEDGNVSCPLREVPIGPQASDYSEALARFLTVWTSRAATLANSPAHVICDVTGGLDSRSVTAIVLAAGKKLGNPGMSGVLFNSNSSQKPDYEIAQELAEAGGFELSGGTNLFSNRRPTGETAFQSWQRLSLGVYALLYMPGLDMPEDLFWFGGEGGESIRTFYRCDGAKDLISRILNARMRRDLGGRLVDEALADLERIGKEIDFEQDPGRVHYRNFRERFHGGRRGSFVNAMSPLTGRDAKLLADLSEDSVYQTGQINRDIVANTVPALLLVDYDSSGKPSGQAALDACHRVRPWMDDVRTDGQLFGYKSAKGNRRSGSHQRFLELIHDEFLRVRADAVSLEFFSDDYLAKAEKVVQQAAANGRFSNIVESRILSHVLFAGTLAGESTGIIGKN